MPPILVFLFFAALIVLYTFRFQLGVPSRQTLLPFQQGLLYRRGRPVRVVGPGRHRIFRSIDKIMFLDTRPIQFNAEQRPVALADGGTGVYGFTLSAEVRDVTKALYSSATYSNVPAFIALVVTRQALSEMKTGQIATGRAAVLEQISATCQTRLAEKGFELLSFQFTELRAFSADER